MAHTTSRRTVIAGLGTAAAATALAACSGGSNNGSNNGSSGNNTSGASGAGTSGGAGSSSGNTSLGSTSDIPVGGGKVFADQQVVVTQPTQGALKCFTAICTHQGCIVHDVTDGTINCACHGSKYSIKDGSVVQGPALSALAPEHISVTGGSITLNS
jgi:Rieske Fe-S protein